MLGFIDTEVSVKSKKIKDIGCINEAGNFFHSNVTSQLIYFLKDVDFLVGHNVIHHDLKYLKEKETHILFDGMNCIDTLFLSPLLFPEKPYHSLVKDDKLISDSVNNPLNDAKKAQSLFQDEVSTFQSLNEDLQVIYYCLLKEQEGFSAFFKHLCYKTSTADLPSLIKSRFLGKICIHSDLSSLIHTYPIELAYSLALINTKDNTSLFPPWVVNNYSNVEKVMQLLRNIPCRDHDCEYCVTNLSGVAGLKRYFDYDKFRVFNGEPLQENAVEAALNNESFIVVFPTGGGKSLTYQLPALMNAETTRGLTVIISPLQSLMKDQVDNLEKMNIVSSVAISGLLNPIERKEAISRVADGRANLMYIAPESLRSATIEKLIMNRQVVRFVIDEAHCFSTWGQDFRVDYMYIGKFIKKIQAAKNMNNPIPISCFTATAKRKVIEDISNYFYDHLGLKMKVFQTSGRRDNLKYKVYLVEDTAKKYQRLRTIIEQENCPTIVYASRRKTVEKLYLRLLEDGLSASFFHGGVESNEKVESQNKFMRGETQIMVATSAFGMGVDKKDIGCIIHYEISDSLENYVQESGRAGRDESIQATCYILYQEDDLDKHFTLLNQSKLTLKEIQQVWKAIRKMTYIRDTVCQSALEISKEAGWEDSTSDVTTRVTSALAALEEAGFLIRGLNSPRIYANSLRVSSLIDAQKKIIDSGLFDEQEQVVAIRIAKKLISEKWKHSSEGDTPESRVDYIADIEGIDNNKAIRIVNLLREAAILADDSDIRAIIKSNSRGQNSLSIFSTQIQLLHFIIGHLSESPQVISLKALNEEALEAGLRSQVNQISNLLNYLKIAKYIDFNKKGKDYLQVQSLISKEILDQRLNSMLTLSEWIVDYLNQLYLRQKEEKKDEKYVLFSLLQLKEGYIKHKTLLKVETNFDDIQEALLFLHKCRSIEIEGGFFVTYVPMKIERTDKSKRSYSKADFQKLEYYYETKKQLIHIVGEYASKMLRDYQDSLQFVDDYFQLDYEVFINKYFTRERQNQIKQNMTPKQFKKLFGSLDPQQMRVIMDKTHSRIAIAAGPGSGKTKVLVHKLASILYAEDIHSEQLLMLTFSRAAATEFKLRLRELIGSAANYIEIKTFHSYCFDIIGRVGTLEKTDEVINHAIEMIQSGEAEPSKISKSILVIDEAQDMNVEEFKLINALIVHNEDLRIVAVGDDDQNIFQFRGSSSEYFRQIASDPNAFYELPTNYRSQKNLVDFANQFLQLISHRLKKSLIQANIKDNGCIKRKKYLYTNMIVPVVHDVLSDNRKGTTCILTQTNEEALHIAGLLRQQQKSVTLIQNIEGFSLMDLYEIRDFWATLQSYGEELIQPNHWEAAIQSFQKKHSLSSNFSLCQVLFHRFIEATSGAIYISDFREYVLDSNMEDFYGEAQYIVSTYHKAKGKEFDNVILLYHENYQLSEETKHSIYVGITRAKSYLSIHTNSDIFDFIQVENQEILTDHNEYRIPNRLAFQLTHRDVNLGYFQYVQHNVVTLISGEKLVFDGTAYLMKGTRRVLQLSKKYIERLHELESSHYKVVEATVKYMVYWKNEVDKDDVLVVLPELIFELDPSIEKDGRGNDSNQQREDGNSEE